MDKKKLQQLLIAIPIVLAALVYCYIKYLIKPLAKKEGDVLAEMSKIESEFLESQGRASRLPMLEEEIRMLRMDIEEMQKKLPHDKDVPGLIRLLSERMKFYGLFSLIKACCSCHYTVI